MKGGGVTTVMELYFPVTILQDGRDGGVTSPESRRLKGLEGGVGDGGEPQRCARHPRDVVQAAGLLITRSYIRAPGRRAGVMKRSLDVPMIWLKMKYSHTDVLM